MPRKRVLDVGNCGPDHGAIRRTLEGAFEVEVLQADAARDTLELLRREPVDLVLINRKLDCDYSDGLEVLRQIKAEPGLSDIPVMIVTNYAEYQEAAVQAGAEWGFGKLALADAETHARLARFLA